MEFEDRNPRPESPTNGLPVVVLAVLIGIVGLLLYGGWYLMSDNASDASELVKDELSNPAIKAKDSILVDSADIENIKLPQAEEPKATEVPEPEKPKTVEVEETEPSEKVAIKTESKKKEQTSKSTEFTTITIKEGQTFLGIANKYNLSYSKLKGQNEDVNPEGLKVGKTKIKVPIQAIHTVGPGDILKVVGAKYGVSIQEIMTANGKTKNFAERGEKLIIPLKK